MLRKPLVLLHSLMFSLPPKNGFATASTSKTYTLRNCGENLLFSLSQAPEHGVDLFGSMSGSVFSPAPAPQTSAGPPAPASNSLQDLQDLAMLDFGEPKRCWIMLPCLLYCVYSFPRDGLFLFRNQVTCQGQGDSPGKMSLSSAYVWENFYYSARILDVF